jgi:hypothetical protein
VQRVERYDVMRIKMKCYVINSVCFYVTNRLPSAASDSDCVCVSHLSCTLEDRAQRTRKLGGPRRDVAGRMLALAVPCRCVPSAGCWAGSLVVRGKGLVVAKVDQLQVVENISQGCI